MWEVIVEFPNATGIIWRRKLQNFVSVVHLIRSEIPPKRKIPPPARNVLESRPSYCFPNQIKNKFKLQLFSGK